MRYGGGGVSRVSSVVDVIGTKKPQCGGGGGGKSSYLKLWLPRLSTQCYNSSAMLRIADPALHYLGKLDIVESWIRVSIKVNFSSFRGSKWSR